MAGLVGIMFTCMLVLLVYLTRREVIVYVETAPETAPVRVETNHFRPFGMLTPQDGNSDNKIVQLMGRVLNARNSKFQYYAVSNQHNNIKVPLTIRGKRGLNEYGVDELFTGDTVYVEGYNTSFTVSMYDSATIQYLALPDLTI